MKKLLYVKRLLGDVLGFAASNKAWWLVPIIIILLLVAALAVLGQSAAPFIYALF